MKAGSGCSSIAVFIDSKGYASISIATDVHRCPAYIPSVVFRTSTRVNDGTVWLGYAAAAMVDERRRQREEQHEIERMALTHGESYTALARRFRRDRHYMPRWIRLLSRHTLSKNPESDRS
jgi:hypothetical protein